MTDRLARRLGPADAVVLGLGSMLGAGVFAVFGPAAAVAGPGLLPALGVAAVIAYANAMSSARLAARYPESGGTYVYGRRRLGPVWGFAAGWAFVVGKTASCAAMALTFGAYAWPDHATTTAAAAVVVLTAVNYLGITKTALLTRVLVGLTLLALTVVVVGGLAGGDPDPDRLDGWADAGPRDLLQAAALLFFAFAGYARIATLGEEVRDPARTIPRAIPLALGIVVAVYATVGVTALLVLGPGLDGADAPLAAVLDAGSFDELTPVARIGGAAASAGVLLSLLAGIGRTTLAMARDAELPTWLAAIHPRHRVPHRAEVLLGAAVLGIVLIGDVRDAIEFSSFAVLLYYAIANAAALTLGKGALAAFGLVGCLVLAATLPVSTVLLGGAVVGAGLMLRGILRGTRGAVRPHRTPPTGDGGPSSRP